MKRVICSVVVAVATMLGAYAHDVISIEKKGEVTVEKIEHCYLMKKHSDGSTYVIRYMGANDEWQDVYVTEVSSGVYYGYESDGNYRIIAKKTTDIATHN